MSKSNPQPPANPRGHYFPAELRQRLSDDLHLTGKAKRTHDGYIRAVRQLSDFAQCSPDKVTQTQVRQFFLHLKNDREFAYGSLRVALSGVKFFFTFTCKRDWEIFSMLKLQTAKTLPVVLTIEQVHRIMDATKTDRLFVFFWTVYTMGLRLNEALSLQVGDIDAARGFVHIHRGKGAKDRYLPLPLSTLKLLRSYWSTHQHPSLLFPGDGRNHTLAKHGISAAENPMSEKTVQEGISQITGAMKLGKRVTLHTLRHCYATHLLEAGVGLKALQKLMGHSSLQSTMIYLHLTETAEANSREVINTMFGKLPREVDHKLK
ncbi:Tyrosine recombinase XerD [Rubripirellula tenax]|uniref:Tyrosine recombinase XerD n=1 Tax=Rubripirellula tenax TaxID=2528015 RepID=A0A5C6FH23_9BACT|nr:site-specific integrase [Rubripirellula tenax]TWU58881.1 Tyrosine recombinase XerD [Rubripirellula tenax]